MALDPTVAAVIALLAETFPRCFTVYEADSVELGMNGTWPPSPRRSRRPN